MSATPTIRMITIPISVQETKKLVMVLPIFMSMTEQKTEELGQEPCIRYLIIFKDQTEALLDTKSEVNAMNQAFAHQLKLKIQKTNI